jgi:hypothetical protein
MPSRGSRRGNVNQSIRIPFKLVYQPIDYQGPGVDYTYLDMTPANLGNHAQETALAFSRWRWAAPLKVRGWCDVVPCTTTVYNTGASALQQYCLQTVIAVGFHGAPTATLSSSPGAVGTIADFLFSGFGRSDLLFTVPLKALRASQYSPWALCEAGTGTSPTQDAIAGSLQFILSASGGASQSTAKYGLWVEVSGVIELADPVTTSLGPLARVSRQSASADMADEEKECVVVANDPTPPPRPSVSLAVATSASRRK